MGGCGVVGGLWGEEGGSDEPRAGGPGRGVSACTCCSGCPHLQSAFTPSIHLSGTRAGSGPRMLLLALLETSDVTFMFILPSQQPTGQAGTLLSSC